MPLRNRDDLSMAYTPGVARVCLAIAEHPEDARRLTIKRNSVAVVTDGSAVLGLGNLGPAAALPVMEGKAALFKRFADIDAWPICLDTQDVDEIVRTVQLLAPVFGGINLEDIAAPRCFEVERRLRELLDIPVFHDDQHGTAIVVLAALTNALRVVDKKLAEVRIVLSGAGAAGSAIARLLLTAGAQDVVVCDIGGVVHPGREGLDPNRVWLAENTNPRGVTGTLVEALAGADVFIGVSAPGILTGDDIATMAPRAIVFALANPDPEVDPAAAPADGRDRGHRAQRRAEPDQQRPGLPRGVPRAARRRRARGRPADGGSGRPGARRRRHGRGAQRDLHRPERLRPRGRRRGGRCGPRPRSRSAGPGPRPRAADPSPVRRGREPLAWAAGWSPRPYDQTVKTVPGKTDRVVIVGAGLAGLSAALRLAGAGREVTVLEREDVPGGRNGLLELPPPTAAPTASTPARPC